MKRILGYVWSAIKAFNTLALFIILFALFAALAGGALKRPTPSVPKDAALAIAPEGTLRERPVLFNPFAFPPSAQPKTVLLRDVLRAIRAAKDDDRIRLLVLSLDKLELDGIAAAHEIRRAVKEFRESGKPVIAVGDSFDQQQYLVASAADEIWMHPEGAVMTTGYGSYPLYFAEGLQKAGVNVHVFKVGTYKSAVEPFIRNDMSPEAKEANRAFLSVLWDAFLDAVAQGRGIERAALVNLVDNLDQAVVAANGDLARLALDAKLVDALKTHEEMKKGIAEKLGREGDKYPRVDLAGYLRALDHKDEPKTDATIAVVTVEGAIVDGEGEPDEAGAERIVPLIRKATKDDKVKAIVLRVNSPGGSAFASELIRQALLDAKAEGKPVVASMGSVAASGGYWISSTSDEIWAEPTTITGSIGIFGLFFTFEDTAAKFGVHSDGVGTTPFADAFHPARPFNPRMAPVIQKVIEKGYDDFLTRVAEGRKMTKEQVDRIGQGRVWAGATAKELGLVDNLGDLRDAAAAAARLAGLEEGRYRIRHVEEEIPPFLKLLMQMAQNTAQVVAGAERALGIDRKPARVVREIADHLSIFTDPRGAYALCVSCEVR
ncbi:MAG: protease [Rhodothalassiaceae bacterium]|nr:MAG: protease [Rhodothalassiaceae bacterium]